MLRLRQACAALLLLALGALAPGWAAAAAPAAQQLMYRFEYTNTTHSDLRGLFGMDPATAGGPLVHDIDSRVSGKLEWVRLEVEGRAYGWFRLRGPATSMSVDGADAREHALAIARQLQERPTLVEFDDEGAMARVYFDPDMDEAARAYARALLASMQLARPRGGAASWERTEEDQAGTYVARYSHKGDALERKRLRYLPAAPAVPGEPNVAQLIEPSGETKATLGPDGTVLGFEGNEQARVSVNRKEIAAGDTAMFMTWLSTSAVSDPVELERLRAGVALRRAAGRGESLAASAAATGSDESLYRNELGTDTVDTLLAQLQALPAEADTTPLYLKFKALANLQPEASAHLGAALAVAAPNSAALLVLSQALAAAGHAPAQDALAQVVRARRGEWPVLATLVPTLGGVTAPAPATVDLLLSLAADAADPETASLARLALGGLAARSARQAPEQSARVLAWLRAGLSKAQDVRTRRDLLLALGNAADGGSLLAFAAYAHDASPEVRAAVMSALRRIDAPPARAWLLAALAGDADAEVRRSAALALADKPMDHASFDAQRAAFEKDADSAVRVALLPNLWAAVEAFPEALAIVEAARGDRSEAVRNAAAHLAGPAAPDPRVDEFFAHVGADAAWLEDSGFEWLEQLPAASRLRIAERALASPDPSLQMAGAQQYYRLGMDDRGDAAAAELVLRGIDPSGLGWGWLHSGDAGLMDRRLAGIRRALSARYAQLTPAQKRRADEFLCTEDCK